MAGPGDGCHPISPAPNGAPRCSPRWPSPTAPGPPHPAPLAPRGSEARWRPARPCAESNREAVVLLLGGLLTAPAEAPPSVPRAPRHLARLPSSFHPFRGRTFRPCSPRAPNGLNRCLLLSWSFSVDLRGLSRVGSTEAPPSERASVCDPVGRRRIGHTGSLSAPPPRWGEAGDLRLTGPARRRATSSSRRGPARGGPGRVLTALTWRPEELRAGPTWSPQGRAASALLASTWSCASRSFTPSLATLWRSSSSWACVVFSRGAIVGSELCGGKPRRAAPVELGE
jgi:hypothetical protein